MCSEALVVSLVLLLCIVASTSVTSNFTDLHSLIAFKSAIKFDPGNVLAGNWTLDTNFCSWYGVYCSKRRQRVVALRLSHMGLVGPISPQIDNLSFLTILDLTNNSFHGHVVEEFGRLARLQGLFVAHNDLQGQMPISLTLCRKLTAIETIDNNLSGILPVNLTVLPRLRYLALAENNLTGVIPGLIGNMSNLQVISLEQNKFHGTIPHGIAYLPRLKEFTLGGNYFTGAIPLALFNISTLELLSLAFNSFTGDLPHDTGLKLPNLLKLFLGTNQLTGNIPSHVYNVSRLTLLGIESNNFTGTLPITLPPSLRLLSAFRCNLQGEIPKEIGTLKNLTFLNLDYNRFSGVIPSSIDGMESIQQLYLHNNELEGPIPKEICSLSNLGNLYLGNNRFSASIPECIGNLTGLQRLSLGSNKLTSIIPQSLWSLDKLLELNLSANSLQGHLGQYISRMKDLESIDLSLNQLSGNISATSGLSQNLFFLDLSWNFFTGSIPESFGNLISLVDMDISHNNLSGKIPKSLEALKYLEYIDVSYNKLSGDIPTGGPFVNFTLQSFIENQDLCGEPVSKSCPNKGERKSKNTLLPLSYIVPTVVFVLIVGALLYVKISRNNIRQDPENPGSSLLEQRMISFHELSHATNEFSEANILGSGGFGSVYKGILSDGQIVAVKLLNLTINGAMGSFDAECKVLRTVRHRNLVKVISTCSNPELRALVLEYISNGSLEKWLYSHNYCLSFLQRVSIMLDIAVAIDYLHCGQSEAVIHCDLKPSNVLLDDDMVAHVGDFGIAKILTANKNETQTSTLGTIGYIAPEYGREGRVSTKGDVYNYGIMLLETFTRKKPTDGMFSEELSLRQWVNSYTANDTIEIIDENLLNTEVQGRTVMSLKRDLLAILDLGLGCSRDLPEERFQLKDVVTKLNKIKLQITAD